MLASRLLLARHAVTAAVARARCTPPAAHVFTMRSPAAFTRWLPARWTPGVRALQTTRLAGQDEATRKRITVKRVMQRPDESDDALRARLMYQSRLVSPVRLGARPS